MIATITLNPAVDKLYLVDGVQPGTVMRVKEVSNTAGGKGLNVSKVAALCGEAVSALGFLGGYNGQYVRSLLGNGIHDYFTEVAGETRSCINIRDGSTGIHTEFLEPGPPVSPEDYDRLLRTFQELLPSCDAVTISGSTPVGAPEDLYQRLIELAKESGTPILLDTSGTLLQRAVQAKPTLIKPNSDEIAQLTNRTITKGSEAVEAAWKLHRDGIPYVVVSLGAGGSVMACDEGIYRAFSPEIPTVNTVGCGDSMLAALAVGITRGQSAEEMLRYATAVSAANAMTMPTGFFHPEDRDALYPQVQIELIGDVR